MNELQVIVTQKPAEISFNFDEIKQNLSEQMEIYKSMEVTEEVLAERKKDIATLRKIAKAIDDKRKEVKSGYMIPYDEFEKKAKELIEIVNEPIELINKQVKEFDEKQKAEKKMKALAYFQEKVGEVEITFEEIFSQSWLLTATSFKSIKADIDAAISNRQADIESIKAMHSEVEDKALATYKATKRLADAIKVINDYDRQKAEILRREEERRKAEEECKRREEERRIREEQERLAREQRERELAAERERQAEIERIRAEERAKVQAEIEASKAKIEIEPITSTYLWDTENVTIQGREIAFPGTEDEGELPFPVDDEREEEPDSEEIPFIVEEEENEPVIFKKYLVKATKKQHDMITKTLDGLGLQWQV